MTFQQALREAERTGCLFFRPVRHALRDIPFSILESCSAPGLGYATSVVLALGTGHTELSPNAYRWTSDSLALLGHRRIKGAWCRSGGGLGLQVEDFCADDWVTVPLTKWFLFHQPNAWNPLKVPLRWEPGGELDWAELPQEESSIHG